MSYQKLKLLLLEDDPRNEVIGRIALRHSQLETVLKMAVKVLARITPDDAMAITSDIHTSDVRPMIEGLARLRSTDPQLIKHVEKLMAKAEKCAKKRNNLLHSMWAFDEDGTLVQYRRQPGKKRHRFQAEEVPSLEECKAIEKEIEELVTRLNDDRLRGTIAQLAGVADATARAEELTAGPTLAIASPSSPPRSDR